MHQADERHAKEHSYYLQSAYDDLDVINGHGDVAREVQLQVTDNTERVHFVPVGGGSLLAGTLHATEQSGDRVAAVQFSTNTSLEQSLAQNTQQVARQLGSLAEGSVANIGNHNFVIIQKHRERLEVITVTRQQLGAAVLRDAERHYHLHEAPYFPEVVESPYRQAEATGMIAEAGAHQYSLAYRAKPN